MSADFGELLQSRNLLICVGSGGVGKTSMAAATGLRAALEGRRVLVLTIDPAKRLANSLGLQRFGNDEMQIDLSAMGDVKGELWAMMLDSRHTFDNLIRRVAPNPKARENILSNHVYRNITDTIVGNQEYMATEKLYDVVDSGRYDLVVLDTPPVKNALDFLESPGRMSKFVDKRIMKWFLMPYDEGKIFGKFFKGTSAVLFRLLSYVFGREFLADLSEFFVHFRDLYEGFQERHEAVLKMFHASSTGFLVVSAPNQPAMDVARFFVEELQERKMPGIGVLVNQRHMTLGESLNSEEIFGEKARSAAADLAPHTAGALLARLGASHRRLRELSALENDLVSDLSTIIPADQSLWSVPRLPGEVHDLQGLSRVGDCLFGERS